MVHLERKEHQLALIQSELLNEFVALLHPIKLPQDDRGTSNQDQRLARIRVVHVLLS